MDIRAVGPDDWADWRRMRIRSLTEDPEAFASSVTMWTGDQDTENRWRERLAAPGVCFLAYDDAATVGMVAARPTGTGVELISMWVAPEARQGRIGGRLVDQVIDWADHRPLTLRVIDGNRTALSVYQSRGFVLQPGRADAEGCRSMARNG